MEGLSSRQSVPLANPPVENPAGIGLRHVYYKGVIETKPDIGWIEVHPENYFGGGEHRHYLTKARELYPLSFSCRRFVPWINRTRQSVASFVYERANRYI